MDSFMKSLFHGVIAENMIFPYPEPSRVESDKVNGFIDGVRKFFATQVDSAAIDREQMQPDEVLAGLKELGLFGLSIPTEYGGAGLTATGYARVMQEIAGLDPSLAVTIGGHTSLGVRGVLLFGTEAQKKKYLP